MLDRAKRVSDAKVYGSDVRVCVQRQRATDIATADDGPWVAALSERS